MSRSRVEHTSLFNGFRVPFRFHPNGTGVPAEIPTYGGYGSPEVKSVEYSATGKYKVTLYTKHQTVVSAYATYHTEAAQAVNDLAAVYNITCGSAATNTFYVQLFVAGSLNSPTYAAGTWIQGEIVFEERGMK